MLTEVLLLTAAVSIADISASPQPTTAPAVIDTMSDTWVATDALGRSLPSAADVGPPRSGKYVGAFYFLWIGQHGTDGPYDITRILAQDPNAMTKPDSPLWGPVGHMHFWSEPLFGYYLSDDPWVLAKHAQMLADAGVDMIAFDVTNQFVYTKVYTQLCKVFTQVRKQGRRTPQIVFLCPFGDPSRVVAQLYKELYAPGLYSDLWFQWKGKPLIMADPKLSPPETRDFFTFRKPQPDYFQGPTGPDQWGWLEIYPQHAFYNQQGKAEQVTVGVAQNGSGKRLCAFSEANTYGRSWHDGAKDARPEAVNEGLNFAEQWKRAFELDPELVFITGWNEWVASRFGEFAGVREPVMFVDQYTEEYSRDVEPMKGGHGDNYYYQMVSNIRRFKGVRPLPPRSGLQTIKVDGNFADWASVQPEYRDDRGDTMHRDHLGFGKAGRYVNRTGRNDFVAMKVSRDDQSVGFYVRTAKPITPSSGKQWMMLLIDADNDTKTGWCGYDFVVNQTSPQGDRAVMERYEGGAWKLQAKVAFAVQGNEMELTIPRHELGLQSGADVALAFKWADNLEKLEDPLEFIVDGDVAPNGRFSYVYR